MKDNEVCSLCRFFNRQEADKGECRRQPPSAVIMPMPIAADEKTNSVTIMRPMKGGRGIMPARPKPGPQAQRVGPVGYWPPTGNNMWCGEFKPEEK